MPQNTAKNYFSRTYISKNSKKNAPAILQNLAVTRFQEIQKNITGGAE